MDQEHRDAIKASNRRRAAACPTCGAAHTIKPVPADQVGGLPGIEYKQCSACGYVTAVVKRQRKPKL